jgi:hypothetical protein
MSENSPNLALPFLLAAQAQKHVTVNEALRILDGLVQLSVLEARASPPGSPVAGTRYLVTATATGAWAGWEGSIALFDDNAWRRLIPQEGWLLWNVAASEFQRFDGSDVGHARGGRGRGLRLGRDRGAGRGDAGGRDQPACGRGAGGAADACRRRAPAEDQQGRGGRDRLVLFQSDWSGRAEMGLAGEDDFSFKVSPDGAAWHTALTIAAADGIPDLRAGATIGGSLAYRRANILGPVSQAGGVPTGAVIESGSNSNGSYVRFADGTQICRHRVNAGSATAFGSGTFNDPYRTAPLTWTYPAAFASKPEGLGRAWTESASANNRRMMFVARLRRRDGNGADPGRALVGPHRHRRHVHFAHGHRPLVLRRNPCT